MRLVESWAGSVAILSVHANLQRVGPCKGAADILDAAQIGSGYIDHLSVRLSHTADAEINPFAKPPAVLGRLKAVERILE
jgi:hypothetical protein